MRYGVGQVGSTVELGSEILADGRIDVDDLGKLPEFVDRLRSVEARCSELRARAEITANLRIESDDLSGQTSNSQTAHKGFKPKTLTVSLAIPFVDQVQLRSLMRLAEATAGGGQLHMYRIVNDTAAAFGIREVQFSDGVSAREDDILNQWLVQFTLSEKLSNPERVENRRKRSMIPTFKALS